ncbi:NADAR family protein [Arcicella lustrica]|uniref:NADAR domain-containing protein n=1 Tax=Arcicella lustrica TaxID=2984196 RepID=A0ABU5SLD4_9BACT|nr:NADAR domain-containing protein [Arcicella sp. DC25W]MEA5428078.1 NADAR domain-containing protein [Arcicella sp. DC25W]
MENIDYNNLPETLTLEQIEYFMAFLNDENNAIWNKVCDSLTIDQRIQILDYNQKIERQKYEEWLFNATQEEKDIITRGSTSFYARDHWFATIFDVYEVVNNTGGFANWGIDKIRNSSPINYTIEEIEMRLSYMKEEEVFFFFSGSTHPFSICFPVDIKAHDTVFKSALHYLVYEKACLFLDRDNIAYLISDKIHLQDLPLLNKQIKYYSNYPVWQMAVGDALKKVLTAKFTQNEELKTALFNTKGKTIVLADVNDNRWGVGLTENDSRILKRATWQGKNLLGELLTVIRFEMMGEY